MDEAASSDAQPGFLFNLQQVDQEIGALTGPVQEGMPASIVDGNQTPLLSRAYEADPLLVYPGVSGPEESPVLSLTASAVEALAMPVPWRLELQEDQSFQLSLQELLADSSGFGSFQIIDIRTGDVVTWLSAASQRPDAQLDGRLVIEAELRRTDDDLLTPDQLTSLTVGAELRLDLLVSDNRSSGRGLLGLEGNLRWNPRAATVLAIDLNESLPLFRDTDDLAWSEGQATLVAAGLPLAGVGQPLGDQRRERFAQVRLRLDDPSQPLAIGFSPSLYPAVASQVVAPADLLNLGLDRPPVPVLTGLADQPEVGTHALQLEALAPDGAIWQRSLLVEVRNSNDAPVALPAPAEITVPRESPFRWLLAELFSDDDISHGDSLSYTLVSGAEGLPWLRLDAETGLLSGTPPEGPLSQQLLQVRAMDRSGASVSRTLQLTLQSINHAPRLDPAVPWSPLVIRQGEEIVWSLPQGSILDPDPLDQLSFSLVQPRPWLTIDPATGQLQVRPGPEAVGRHTIAIVATDAAGASIQRDLLLEVTNSNDAPRLLPQALEAFLLAHGPVLRVQEDQPLNLALFAGGSWFSDADLAVAGGDLDALEHAITLSRQQPDGSYEPVAASWLQLDPATARLQLTPDNQAVGRYRLRLSARDREGLEASTSIGLEVVNSNDPPQLNPAVAAGFATITLAEDQAFDLTVPPDLFIDHDRGDALTLTVRTPSGDPLPAWIQFDSFDLRLHGVAGSERGALDLLITATDRHGASTDHALQLLLPRIVEPPVVQIRTLRVREGQPLALAEALQAACRDPDSETLLYRIALDALASRWEPVSRQGTLPEAVDGVLELGDLNDLQLRNLDQTASGTVSLPVEVISLERNGQRASRAVVLTFEVDPVVAPPLLTARRPETPVDPFDPPPLAAFAAATPVDADGSEHISRFELTYRPSLQHPSAEDLQVHDSLGVPLGQWTVRQRQDGFREWVLSLTASQWHQAILSSHDRPAGEEVRFTAVAFAQESATGEEASSASQELQLPCSPRVLPPSLLALGSSERVGVNDGGSTDLALFRFSAETVSLRDHSALLVSVPAGTTVLPSGPSGLFAALPSPAPDGDGNPVLLEDETTVVIQPDQLGDLLVQLLPPEGFTGHLPIRVQALATARPAGAAGFISLTDDLAKGFAALGEVMELDLTVVPRARPPRLDNLRFDADSGALLFDLTRGVNSRGSVNPEEQIILSISGVPEGYGLVLPDDIRGLERPAGASDAFATAVLFSIPAQPDDPAAAAAPIRLPLRLRSLASPEESLRLIEAATVQLQASAQLAPTTDLPIGDRSATVSASLAITSWTGSRPALALDPVLIDLAGDGLALNALELSPARFDLLLSGRALQTAWLAPGEGLRDDAFLVLDRDRDGAIRSSAELVSEFFGSTDQTRTFSTGFAALTSLDSNLDGRLDGADADWASLQLWFDDGDGLSLPQDLVPVAAEVAAIFLTADPLQGQSAAGNPLLRRGVLQRLDGESAPFFDVGLRFDPHPQDSATEPGALPRLALQASLEPGPGLKEGGDAVVLRLDAPALENLSPEEADLTLVRLLGLPEAIEPSLGMRDRRGDWLFTWADLRNLRAQGRDLALQSIDHSSGAVTAAVLITRLGLDGSIVASAVTPLAVDVVPVADRPQLLLRRIQGQEDTPLLLETLLQNGAASLGDRDGSEHLLYQLSGLPQGVQLARRLPSGTLEPLVLEADPPPATAGSQRLAEPLASLQDLWLVPAPDRSGRLEFTLTAMARESANGETAALSRTATVFIAAVVDPPRLTLLPGLAASGLLLQEEGTAALQGIEAVLVDRDGSEELLVELQGLPDWVRLERADDPDWRPGAQVNPGDGTRRVRVHGDDLASGQLRLRDVITASVLAGGVAAVRPKDDFILQMVALSREVSNGQLSFDQATLQSEPQQLSVRFASRPHRPELQVQADLFSWEDDRTPLALASVVRASLSEAARREELLIELRGLPPGLELRQASGEVVHPQRWEAGAPVHAVTALDGLVLVPTTPQLSGRVSLSVEAIARSLTGGAEARSGPSTLWVAIQPVADPPQLQAPSQWLINPDGRVSLAGLQLGSADADGSERLSLVIFDLPQGVEILGQARPILAPGADGRPQTAWEIAAADLVRVQLQVPENHPDLHLVLRARSREIDGGDRFEAWGAPQAIAVLAGALASVPELELSGVLLGDEDTPIPLLQVDGGVLRAALVGSQPQRLQFSLQGLPPGAVLRRRDGDRWQTLVPEAGGDGRYNLDSLEGVAVQLGADASGSHRLVVEAIATALRSGDRRTITLEVPLQVRPLQDAPRALGGEDLSLQEGEERTVSLAAWFLDPDAGDALRYGIETPGAPDWITVDATTGLLHLHPGREVATPDGQPQAVVVSATDRAGRQARQLLRVAVGNVNQAPRIRPGEPSEVRIGQDQPLELRLADLFDDPDRALGDSLQVSIATLPPWLTLSSEGVLSGTPGNDAVGSQRLQLTARDSGGLEAGRELLLTVENRNDAPTLGAGHVSGEVQHLLEDQPFQLDLSGLFEDPDSRYGDSLRISTSSSRAWPGWLRWDGSTGLLSGTPANDDVGEVTISWIAGDGDAQVRYDRTFVVGNVNDIPIARSLPPQRLEQDGVFVLDLSDLIVDPDFGDSLTYEVSVRDDGGHPVDAGSWLNLRDRQQEDRPPDDRLHVQPVMRDSTTAEVLTAEQFRQLSPGALVTLELLVRDDRLGITERGLLGVDLDLRWTPESLELVSNDPNVLRRGLTPDLPLFASVDTSRLEQGRLALRAASAPALGIGSLLGDQPDERLLQLQLRVRDPQRLALVDLQVREEDVGGIGLGWMEAGPAEARISLGSWSSARRLEFQARPHNDQVGRYSIAITGRDSGGSSASSRFLFEVEDRNDAPVISRRLDPARFRDERRYSIDLDQTFGDPDLRHGDRLTYGFEVLSGAMPEDMVQISLQRGNDGAPQALLQADVPGLTTASEVDLRVWARDRAGLEISQTLSLSLEPAPDPIPLLSSRDDPAQIGKNQRFNLAESLALAPIGRFDPRDLTTLHLRSLAGAGPEPAQALALSEEQRRQWLALWSQRSDGDAVEWSCDLQTLASLSGVGASGVLAAIDLLPPLNGGKRLPSGAVGLPLQLWTETRVRGDDSSRFGVERSASIDTWLLIGNNAPAFDWSGRRSLVMASPGPGLTLAPDPQTPLWSITDLFPDQDRLQGDLLQVDLGLPQALQGLLDWDPQAAVLRWDPQARISDALVGRHLIDVRGRDSQFSLGDPLAFSRGSLVLEIRSATQASLVSALTGLQALVNAGGSGDLQRLQRLLRGQLDLDDPSLSLEQRSTLAATRSLLDPLPSLRLLLDQVSADQDPEALVPQLLQTLARGQAVALRNSVGSPPPLFLYGEGAALSQAGLQPVDPDLLRDYLSRYPAAGLLTPIEELSFEVSAPVATSLEGPQRTIGFAVVNLELPLGGYALNRLIKTRPIDSNGDGVLDTTLGLDYNLMPQPPAAASGAEPSPAELLKASQFDIVSYGDGTSAPVLRLDSNDPMAGRQLLAALQARVRDGEDLAAALRKLDGSGYLIDLDGDGRVDLIRTLLLDQGFFDTIDRPGLIGDPIIPARLVQGEADGPGSGASPPSRGRSAVVREAGFETGSDAGQVDRIRLNRPPFTEAEALAVDPQARAEAGMDAARRHRRPGVEDGQEAWATASSGGAMEALDPMTAASASEPLAWDGVVARVQRTLEGVPAALPRLVESLTSGDGSRMLVALLIGATLLPLLVERGLVPAAGLEMEPMRIRSRQGRRHSDLRWLLPPDLSGGRSLVLDLVDGRLSIEGLVDDPVPGGRGQPATSAPTLFRQDLLWRLVGESSRPGVLVAQLEKVLHRLIRGGDGDQSIDWRPWVHELCRQHRSGATPPLMGAFVARRLNQLLQRSAESHPGLSDGLMALQVLHCYQQLGGDLGRIVA